MLYISMCVYQQRITATEYSTVSNYRNLLFSTHWPKWSRESQSTFALSNLQTRSVELQAISLARLQAANFTV